MFSSGSRNSISFATVTPSFVMIGAPNFFSITALRPFGPSVIFTASARMLTPRKIACREFSPVTICFAIGLHPPGVGKLFVSFAILGQERLFLAGCRFGHSAESRQDFLFAEDQVFLVVDFDVASGVFAEQDPVAHLHVERDTASLFHLARADGHDFTLLRFFFRRIRDNDPTLGRFFLFQPAHEDAVM